MGFPSPAQDYVERELTVDIICNVTANSIIVETTDGYAVVERATKPTKNSVYYIRYPGGNHFAKKIGNVLVTEEGEVLEGEVLCEVDVKGVLTHLISRVIDEGNPAI